LKVKYRGEKRKEKATEGRVMMVPYPMVNLVDGNKSTYAIIALTRLKKPPTSQKFPCPRSRSGI
jgi:hypothetical protein